MWAIFGDEQGSPGYQGDSKLVQLTGSSATPIDQLHLVKSLQIALNQVFILRFVCHNVSPILQLIFSYMVEWVSVWKGPKWEWRKQGKEGKEKKKRNKLLIPLHGKLFLLTSSLLALLLWQQLWWWLIYLCVFK